ncbi:MAG: glycoside hydrolase family 99-like domain-containing protein [Anaerolineaceae bacterium]
MDVFTSITLNYLPKTKILAKSVKKFHPDWKFHLLISDRLPEDGAESLQADLSGGLFDRVIWIDQLDIPDLSSWIFKHTVVELCTAVKGVYLRQLVTEGCEKIIYIDPDIVVFNDLTPLDEMLDEHAILLTPHLLDYTNNPQSIHDNEIAGTMRHGTFNLGFIAINPARADGRRFTEWWGDRLMEYCYADYEQGLFTDQKWCDLIPSFFEDYLVIRDPGYDVASWNLDCREISFSDQGQIMVNGKYPLRFYHFTGYDSGAGASVISQLTSGGGNAIVKEIWHWYNRQLPDQGHDELGQMICYFDNFDNGKKITKEMRQVYRTSPWLQNTFKNPYQTEGGKGGFYAWWLKERPSAKHEEQKRPNAAKNEDKSTFAAPQRAGNASQAETYVQLLRSENNEHAKEYRPLTSSSLDGASSMVKLVAFYLPQFHPIPENDAWWGKGFTEWANVTRAVPQFPGHYQPHLPGELGFYDLRIKDVQYRQIELARQHGIYGFAFYHYWFAGKRLLEMPINQFLENKDMNFPFCLVWANENWTRRWDGMENDILIAQKHSPELDVAFIESLAPYLRDERYIRINGRPVILVYRVDIMPNPKETTEQWREYCVKNHLGDPYLVAAQTFGFEDPRPVGFDAAVQFPPHNQLHNPRFLITPKVNLANPDYASYIFSYPEVVKYKETDPENAPYPLYKTVFPSWDSEPRKPGKGTIFADSSPQLYTRWLKTACQWTMDNHPPEERFVFINAWNEWAEGAHLEPDRRYGYAYLQATMDVLKGFSK